jgi:hypothetical protein
MTGERQPTLDQAKHLIEKLRPVDRAMLRPWILAKFDVQGNAERRIANSTTVDGGKG